MTACVNRKHTKKVAAVVTASLVGALSLGAAPVAAMADTGIETLALSAKDAFEQGTMTEARDSQNRRLDIPADGIITVESGNFVRPAEVTPKDGDPVDIDSGWVHYEDANGITVNSFNNPGRYTAVVEMPVYSGTTQIDTYTFKVDFIVEDEADLTNATLFDGNGGVSDTTFTYNGGYQDIQVAVNGKKLDSDEYDIYIYKVENGVVSPTYDNNVKDAGTYIANIFKQDETVLDGDHLEKQITFTVGKLNIASAGVSIADVALADVGKPENTVDTVSVPGGSVTTSDVTIVATLPSNSTGKASALVTGKGANVTGTATIEFNVVDNVLSSRDVYYNDASIPADLKINLSDGQSFKPERIVVESAATGETLDSSYYTVSYTDGDGNAVEASALQNPGTYWVVVRANAEASHFKYGSGDIKMKVEVSSATVEDDGIVFKYDGKVGVNFTDTYDGQDFLSRIETIVHTKWGDDLVEGTDYTVTAHNDTTDEDVDQIVDAGKYTITVNLKGTSVSDGENVCHFEVEAFDLTYGLFVNGGDLTAYNWVDGTTGPTTVWYLNYTGEALEPAFELGYYTDDEGKVQTYANVDDNSGKLVWHALPADAYTVTGYQVKDGTSWKDVDEVKDKGEYKVKFALETSNYDIARGIDDENTRNYFTVSASSVAFADVDPNEWYAESVFQAKQLGYIRGIQNSNLYAPNAAITRADALVIISRMAGADTTYGEDWLSQNIGYVTRYSDVNENAYYAKAVAWATKVGVVHGYGDGTFRPDAQITREEFAAYLANYAQAMGKDVNVNVDAVLAEFPDGGQVSDWAENVVAWAAGNDIMGNGGVINPQSQITRAEVAAMAVNYQPNGISADVIG